MSGTSGAGSLMRNVSFCAMRLSRISRGIICLCLLLFSMIAVGAFLVPELNGFSILLIFLWPPIVMGVSGLAALALAFTRYRGSRVSFVCAAMSFDLGLVSALFYHGVRPRTFVWELELASWLFLIFGATALVRWGTAKHAYGN
jgi:hypothetical protein